jgi:hypothetical protein
MVAAGRRQGGKRGLGFVLDRRREVAYHRQMSRRPPVQTNPVGHFMG